MAMLGSSFKYRPPAKLLTFHEIDQADIYQIMTLSRRFGGLCTALEKLLRSVNLFLELDVCMAVEVWFGIVSFSIIVFEFTV